MKLDTCLFIMGLIALPLVFAHSCKVDARRAALASANKNAHLVAKLKEAGE